ncbi:MAG: (2Fe-2S)-binding protein [Candidatus Muirbacterium halophilum]|nr:(2Fe-2S)-binding protein [Candidatus Muirbacterium halophilum]MCK9474292.1 (2Fe-2S)-binding protein [Candidatus Muirbacterium halophilum]
MKEIFNINGKNKKIELRPDSTLLEALRDNGFTEVKNGCEEGQCGACLVLVDDVSVNSCQILAMSVKDQTIVTSKGLGDQHKPSIIQEAYVDAGAVQCGFCTPGFVISTYSLLKKNPNPTEEEIKSALDGNLCRCTGYIKIIDAVKLAAKRMNGGEDNEK